MCMCVLVCVRLSSVWVCVCVWGVGVRGTCACRACLQESLRAGCSPFSFPLAHRTCVMGGVNLPPSLSLSPTEPGAVDALTVSALSPTSLGVTWAAPAAATARLTGYGLRYRERVISDCVVQHAAWSEELEVDQDTHRYVKY